MRTCACGAPLSGKVAKKCRACWKARGSDGGRATYTGRCGHPVSGKRIQWCQACFRAGRHLTPTLLTPEVREPLASFEEAWAQWQRAIGMMRDRYQGPGKARGKVDGVERILVAGDIHAPFHEREMLAAMIAREQGRIDRVILSGDTGDAYALSRFLRYERVPYREEWAEVTAVLQAVSESFPQVEIVIGNHDARLEKTLRSHLTEDAVDAIHLITGGVLCPITAIAKRFPNVTIANHQMPSGQTIDWFTTVGDTWIGHPEAYSMVPASVGRRVVEQLEDRILEWGLERYRLFIIAHTHTYTKFAWRAESIVMEGGCLAKSLGYQMTPRLGGRPQRRGYTTFTQHAGRTDLNSIVFHWFDADDALIKAAS